MRWAWTSPMSADGLHSYRTVLPNEMVCDLGDHTNWIETVSNAHAIMDILNEATISYICALSGGRGIHIHIFGPPRSPDDGVCMACLHAGGEHADGKCTTCTCLQLMKFPNDDDDWRVASARTLLALSTMRKWGTPWSKKLQADPLLLHPNHGSRMIREFGATKEDGDAHGPKTVWHIGPSAYAPIPYSIADAYKEAEGRGARHPDVLPRNKDIPFGVWQEVRSWAVGPCPSTPECLRTRCASCPLQEDGTNKK
jgi:hypothetical protein